MKMNITQDQVDKLARVFHGGETGYPEDFADLDLSADDCVATRDLMESFVNNSWLESSEPREIEGGLYFAQVQASRGDQRFAIAVIDCGDFRLTYKQ